MAELRYSGRARIAVEWGGQDAAGTWYHVLIGASGKVAYRCVARGTDVASAAVAACWKAIGDRAAVAGMLAINGSGPLVRRHA